MPKRRLQRRNFARWTAIGLIFSVAVGIAFVVLADDDRIETPFDLEEENSTSTPEPSIPTQNSTTNFSTTTGMNSSLSSDVSSITVVSTTSDEDNSTTATLDSTTPKLSTITTF